jgi:putative hydrolase of the HAD superfamily
MILVFDLDETLYNELTYVRSGFKAVSAFIEGTFNFPAHESYRIMVDDFNRHGRGKIFNNILALIGKENKGNIKKLISVYHLHTPNITLYKDAKYVLMHYVNMPKYVVTDGNKIVQMKKSEALHLKKYVKKIFITHNYGLDKAKPSTYCFEKIAESENVKKNDICYFADNPYKDFINLKKEGYKTVRIIRGFYKDIKVLKDYEAEYKIHSLYDMKKIIEKI